MHKIIGNQPSAISKNSHSCIRISSHGDVDKLWMPFISYSVVYMFLSMTTMHVNLITFNAV